MLLPVRKSISLLFDFISTLRKLFPWGNPYPFNNTGLKLAKNSFISSIVFESQNYWIRTLQIDQKFDMFRSYGWYTLAFENDTKRNSNIVVEIFYLLLVLILRTIDLCHWKLHYCACIELPYLLSLWLVDSEEINKTIELILHLIKKLIVKYQNLVESFLIFTQKFED